MRQLRLLPLSLSVVLLAACGGDGPTPPAQLPADARVQLASRQLEVNVGGTVPLGASLVTASGQPITNFDLSYATTTAPIQVSPAGVVSGVSAGAGRVRISAGGRVLDSVDVDVFGRPEGVADGNPALASRPFGVAISRQGVGLVTRLDAATATLANTAARSLGNPITVGSTPTGISFNPAGTTAYVANQGAGSVGVVDVASSTQAFNILVPGSPFVTAVSPNGQRVYVGTNRDKVYVIDAASRTIVDSVATGTTPNSIAFSRDGSRFYVANAFSGTASEVNAATNQKIRDFAVGGTPQEVVATRDGSRLYVVNEAGRVDVVALPSGNIGTPIQLGTSAFGGALSPDQSRLYVTLNSTNGVRVIDTATLTATSTITVGELPRRVAFDYYGTRAIVASESGSVTFIR